MRRREFIAGLGSAAAWPVMARAQQPGRMRRIGVLMVTDENDPEGKAELSEFTKGLVELGWIDGRNVRMDLRWATGNVDRVRMFAKELVGLQPDVILANGTPVTAALQHGADDTHRICGCRRPGRRRLRCEPAPPGREYHRLHPPRSGNG